MTDNRRPIQSRSNGMIQALASILARSAVTPNQISCASVVFAAIVACALLHPSSTWAMIIAILGIQLRLLCNVIDGLVAVEGGKKSLLGPIYNEFPDRIADSLLLIAAGYGAGVPSIGWSCALLAAMTAYVRVFGGSLGLPQRFIGPMAKQHRMAVLTFGCIATVGENAFHHAHFVMPIALSVIAGLSVFTCVTRTTALLGDLRQRTIDQNHHA